MPPKKDNKKKGEGPTVKEVDPALFIRRNVALPEPDAAKQLPIPSTSGKIINVETLFPEWSDVENWGEAIPSEKIPEIRYPKWLSVEKTVNFTTFYELDASDAPVDPKAKKKDPPKKPAGKGKGAEEVVEFVELTVNDLGKSLPVVFREPDNSANAGAPSEEFKQYPALKGFAKKLVVPKDNESTLDPSVVDEIDPLVCDAFRIISTFAPLVVNHSKSQQLLEGNEKIVSVDENYLWRAIYPKLPSGKPCYNPQGKYCVKIFFAGKWRKVYVDDSIPLTADGKPAIAFSQDRLELWPLLLSKAVYTVYSATGYTFADELSEAMMVEHHPELSVPLLSSQFVAFIIHILTGWQNHHSVDAAKLFANERSKSIRMLTYMVSSGMPLIPWEDIVEDEPCFRFANDASTANSNTGIERSETRDKSTSKDELQRSKDEAEPISNHPSVDYEEGEGENDEQQQPEAENLVLKTKRRFKEEYLQRKQIRDDIVQRIEQREEKIQHISEILQQAALEIFFVVKYDFRVLRYRVFPVLGLAYVQNEPPNYDNLPNIHFLLDWERFPLEDTIPNVEDPIILGQGKIPVPEFLVPFPKASPIRYLWQNVEDLIDENAYLTGLFTNIDIPYSAELSRHWVSKTPVEAVTTTDPKAKDAKKGGKDAKGKDAPASVEDENLVDPGSLPITFLKLETSQIYEQIEAALKPNNPRSTSREDNMNTVTAETSLVSGDDQELKEAIEDQRQALSKGTTPEPSLDLEEGKGDHLFLDGNESSEVVDDPEEEEEEEEEEDEERELDPETINRLQIKLVITLIADIPTELTSDAEVNPNHPPARVGSIMWDAVGQTQNKILPSDTTIVLQEIQWEDGSSGASDGLVTPHYSGPPLFFVLDMKETAHLPMVSKSYSIPYEKLRERMTSKEPLLFLVRIFSRSSLYVNISANVKIELDTVEKIWTQSLGYHAIVREGDTEVTVQETEQLLFRCPVQFQKTTADNTATANSKEGGATPKDTARSSDSNQIKEDKGGGLSSRMSRATTPKTPVGYAHSKVLVYLFVKEFPIEQLLQLLLININTINQENQVLQIAHPIGQMIPISIDPQYLSQLVAFITPKHRLQQVPKFHWKLIVLAKEALVEATAGERPVQETVMSQRYQGKYIPNRQLRLCRDIYTFEKASFPIAIKFSMKTWERHLQHLQQAKEDKEKESHKTTEGETPATGEEEKKEGTKLENIPTLRAMKVRDSKILAALNRTKALESETPEEIHYRLRLFRKHDQKLVAEFGLNEPLNLYSVPLSLFLPDSSEEETNNTASNTTNGKGGKAAAAPPPAASKGKGKEPAVNPNDQIEIIVECSLDDDIDYSFFSSTSVQSVYPHVFDDFFPNSPDQTSDGIAFYKEILEQQKKYLQMTPPETPLFAWTLDILSGKVQQVSHDLSALTKFVETKKSWEQIDGATAGNRMERALASLTYVQERDEQKKRLAIPSTETSLVLDGGRITSMSFSAPAPEETSKDSATNSKPGSRPISQQTNQRPPKPSGSNKNDKNDNNTAMTVIATADDVSVANSIEITNTMVESLTNALVLSEDEVKNRFQNIHRAGKIEETIEVLPGEINPEDSLIYPHNPRRRLGSELWTEHVSQRRAEEKQKLEDYYQSLLQHSQKLGEYHRQQCAEQLLALSEQYLAQRQSLLEIWKQREQYRTEVETKNAALQYLLKRGKDAKGTAKQQEDAAEAERLKQEAKNAKGKKK